MSETLEKILGLVLLLSLLADVVLRLVWNKTYFTVGVPIFVKRIPVDVQYRGIPFQYLFEEEFQNSWITPLTFKQIDSVSYGFREKYFQYTPIQYFPVMHGLLIFEAEKRQVVVKGIASWFTVWFVTSFTFLWLSLITAFSIDFTNSAGFISPVTFVLLFLGVCYATQCFRYSKVCIFAAQLRLEKHFSKSNEG